MIRKKLILISSLFVLCSNVNAEWSSLNFTQSANSFSASYSQTCDDVNGCEEKLFVTRNGSLVDTKIHFVTPGKNDTYMLVIPRFGCIAPVAKVNGSTLSYTGKILIMPQAGQLNMTVLEYKNVFKIYCAE